MTPYASNPYAAPQAPVAGYGAPQGQPMAHVDGVSVVVANGSGMPPVCLKCGNAQGIQWRDANFRYVPPWARFFGWLIQALVVKKSRFSLPLCTPCNATWKKWTIILALSWIPGLLVLFLGLGLGSIDDGLGAAVTMVGLLVMVVGLVVAAVLRNRRTIWAGKIDKTHTWLRGVHAVATQALVQGPAPQQGYAPAGYAPQAMAPQGYPQPGGYGYPPR